jgi:hypothetical protein
VRPIVCDRSRAWISLRIDGEISQFESVLLRSHLRTCADCRDFADDVAWQTESLRVSPLEQLGGVIEIPRRSWSRRAIEVGTAAAAVAAAAVALVIGIGGSHSRPAAPPWQIVVPSSAVDTESRGLPRASALVREKGVALAHGKEALPQL